MWIPVITILWALGESATWVNFPMVNFPFTTEKICIMYTKNVRMQVSKNPAYIAGYSACIEVPLGEQT